VAGAPPRAPTSGRSGVGVWGGAQSGRCRIWWPAPGAAGEVVASAPGAAGEGAASCQGRTGGVMVRRGGMGRGRRRGVAGAVLRACVRREGQVQMCGEGAAGVQAKCGLGLGGVHGRPSQLLAIQIQING